MLLRLRFKNNSIDCSDATNVGGVSFSESSLNETNANSAFFDPCNDNACLRVHGTTLSNISSFIGSSVVDERQYSIYFKFKIDLIHRISKECVPILSYEKSGSQYKLLTIEDNTRFIWWINDHKFIPSKECSYVFDGRWHTFFLSRMYGLATFYIDGIKLSEHYVSENPQMSGCTSLYIGRLSRSSQTHHYYTYSGGELDDICIHDSLVYYNNFIPPTKYWTGEDVIDNYYRSDVANEMPRVVGEYTSKNILYTVNNLDDTQRAWVPHHIDIQWHKEEYFFRERYYHELSRHGNYTAFSVYGIETLITEHSLEQHMLINAKDAVNNGIMYPFLLFVDKKYYKLSDINIVKSDSMYTLFVDGYTSDNYENRVQSLDIVKIPFKCIYEEGEPTRTDHTMIYCFNDKGYFDLVNKYTVYYKDSELSKEIDVSPIMEDYVVPTTPNPVSSIWRYGFFTQQSKEDNEVIFRFTSKNNTTRAQSGDKINLYKNKIAIDGYKYDVVGSDLIKFTLQDDQEYRSLLHKLITMQIIRESHTLLDNLIQYNQVITMRSSVVKATVDNQIEFKIPDIVDDNGNRFKNYLVFKNSTCLNGKNRFETTIDGKIKLSNLDAMNRGQVLTFMFLKSEELDNQFRLYHPSPVYLYTKTGLDGKIEHGAVTSIKIPEYLDVTYTKNNIFFFVNGTLITQDRYEIENGYVVMNDIEGNSFMTDKDVTFILVRMVTDYEDPSDYQGNITNSTAGKKGHRFILKDLSVDKTVKITPLNLTVFDDEGRYVYPLECEVYSGNIVKSCKSTIDSSKYIPRYLVCAYSKLRSLENKSHIRWFDNDRYTKDYLMLRQEFEELDKQFNSIVSDYQFAFDNSALYNTNLARAYFYSIQYNEWLYVDLYKKLSDVQRSTLSYETINSRMNQYHKEYRTWFHRSEYKDDNHRTYVMCFQDGKIPSWYDTIEYNLNEYGFIFGADQTSDVEMFKFHNMNNTLKKLNNKIS